MVNDPITNSKGSIKLYDLQDKKGGQGYSC